MRPWFTKQHLERYHDDIIAATRSRLDSWRGREQIRLDEEMSRVTLEISSKTLYGIEAREGEQHLAQRMADMVTRLFSPAAMIPLNVPGSPFRRLIRSMQQIEAALWSEIEAKRREGFGGQDILTSMARVHFESPEELTDDEIIGEAFTIFFAGHDTGAKALTWTLFLLAQHPEATAQLLDELDRELDGAPPTFQQVFALPVLDRVIKESLRVLPPAVVFAREAARPATLGGYEIPEGSEILHSPYVLHRDPSIYERPKRFEPDRWLTKKAGPYEYMPFGVGARTCLGASFGMIQLRVMIAMIVQAYRLDVIDGTRIDLKTNVVIGPRQGLPMRARPQDGRVEQSPGRVTGYMQEMVEFPEHPRDA